jgi:hypothetical protein
MKKRHALLASLQVHKQTLRKTDKGPCSKITGRHNSAGTSQKGAWWFFCTSAAAQATKTSTMKKRSQTSPTTAHSRCHDIESICPAELSQLWVQWDSLYLLLLHGVGAVAATQQQIKTANKTACLLKQLQPYDPQAARANIRYQPSTDAAGVYSHAYAGI